MLENKVIVVTGGLGFLGKEFCRSISINGGIVIVTDIDDEIKLFADSLENADYFKLDIIDKNSINQLIRFLDEKYLKIDALVNCAYPRNKNYGNKFEDVEYNDFCENINLNLGGYFLCSNLFSKYFVTQNFGNIINIASIYGVVAPKFELYENTKMTMPVEYAVIKSALIHLTKYMAKYFRGNNIRVNSISLGGLLNNQNNNFIKKYNNVTLNKGMLNPKDISGSLIYLLSDSSQYVNGHNLIVDDGFIL